MSDVWNPKQYERYKRERTQPFLDLLSLVEPRVGLRMLDLGCGTGELTQHAHRHLQATGSVGVDSASAMLARSDVFAEPGLRFVQADLSSFGEPGSFDLVLSNAALHWVADHESLLGRLAKLLCPGGQLAIQVPANFDQPSHVLANEVASEPRFRSALNGWVKPVHVLTPERYAALLVHLGFAYQHVRLQVYVHMLPGRDDVVEWVKGTTLTDYQTRMADDDFEAFVERYRARLREVLADEHPFPFLFKRILMWGALRPRA
jgi:trans-aconitate 2-methyltransferase